MDLDRRTVLGGMAAAAIAGPALAREARTRSWYTNAIIIDGIGGINDPYGATQAWIGHGNALRLADDFTAPQKGKYTQVEVQRSLKIVDGISLNAAARRRWNETATAK